MKKLIFLILFLISGIVSYSQHIYAYAVKIYDKVTGDVYNADSLHIDIESDDSTVYIRNKLEASFSLSLPATKEEKDEKLGINRYEYQAIDWKNVPCGIVIVTYKIKEERRGFVIIEYSNARIIYYFTVAEKAYDQKI